MAKVATLDGVLARMVELHMGEDPKWREIYDSLYDMRTYKQRFHNCGAPIHYEPHCTRHGQVPRDEIRDLKSEKVKLEADA